jgi:hypothetical protein
MLRQVLKSCEICCDFAECRRRFSANTDNDTNWTCYCLKIERGDQVAISAMYRGKAAVAAWTRRPVMPHVHATRGVIARVGNITVELAGVGRDRCGARAASRDHRGCGEHNSKRPKSKRPKSKRPKSKRPKSKRPKSKRPKSKRPKSKRPKSKRHHQKRFPPTLAAALHVPESSPAYLQVDQHYHTFVLQGREQRSVIGEKSWR